eukprot:3858228-Rhodomonas_salina.1
MGVMAGGCGGHRVEARGLEGPGNALHSQVRQRQFVWHCKIFLASLARFLVSASTVLLYQDCSAKSATAICSLLFYPHSGTEGKLVSTVRCIYPFWTVILPFGYGGTHIVGMGVPGTVETVQNGRGRASDSEVPASKGLGSRV